MTDEQEMPEPLSDTTLCVRYNGTSHVRIVTGVDLSGSPDGDMAQLVWSPGSDIAWEHWLRLAGSEDRAREVLQKHSDEFSMVGPGAEEFEDEEFSFTDAPE